MTTVDRPQVTPDSLAFPPSQKEPLRIGLLINSYAQPRWVHKIVADILASPVAKIVLVVENNDTEQTPRSTFARLMHTKSLLYKLYSRVDAHFFTEQPNAFDIVNIESLLSSVTRLKGQALKKKFTDEFPPADCATICEHKLDVVLRFGFRILKGQILQIPQYGVWSYHHGDNTRYRGGPPGFWEVMEKRCSTGAVLQILSEELDNGHVIYRSSAETDAYSVTRNANRCYWQASGAVLKKLREVYEDGPVALKDPVHAPCRPYSNRLYKIPDNREMVPLLARITARYLRTKVKSRLRFKQWFLAYKINTNEAASDYTFYNFKRLIPPKDRFWADPFPMKKDGKYYIFFEELPYRTQKGHLCVVEVDATGIKSGPHIILDLPYHLSYPFVFWWNGTLYMIPESSRVGTVQLYRCVSFPGKWELEKILLNDIRAVDTTVTEIDGRWWMLTGVAVSGARQLYELHIFHAPSPLGPWEPHRSNPVKPDSYTSRGAGNLFVRDGAYYRPTQEGSGTAMFIQKIERLDESTYVETEVGKISASWAEGLVGTHTFNSVDGLTVIDGQLERWRYV